ncbi:MAG: DUF2834 domain-containing protein [Cyclobacteriaceae bacterium]
MKRTYLILTVIGFILPNIFVAKVSIETGNILLYADFIETFKQMFANDISSAFVIDLLFVVMLFLAWTYIEAKKLKMKGVWLVWLFTFAFGIAGGLPLFLYLREDYL